MLITSTKYLLSNISTSGQTAEHHSITKLTHEINISTGDWKGQTLNLGVQNWNIGSHNQTKKEKMECDIRENYVNLVKPISIIFLIFHRYFKSDIIWVLESMESFKDKNRLHLYFQ